jgi:hypothetical protein
MRKTSCRSRQPVNRVSTPQAPCPTLNEGVNPSKTLAVQPTEGKKGCSHGIGSDVDDLFGAIKDFLESKGIEVYRRQSVPECYQVKHNGQTVRFFVQRNE